MRSSRDQYMDNLAIKMVEVLEREGANNFDGIMACCALISFAICKEPPERRAMIREKIDQFLDKLELIA